MDGDVGGEQPDLPTEEALSTRLRKEHLAWMSERARGVRMKNDEAEGLLLPADDVKARVSQAGVAFQKGQAAARRSIEAVCCDKCRGPVVAEHEAAAITTIAAVRGAFEAN